ncbi:MAG: hypothetical protein ABW075_06130 [Aeromicrobium sp.]
MASPAPRASADRARRPSPNVAAVVVLVALAGALLLWQRPWHDDSPAAGVVPLPADAPAQLTAQLRDLSEASSEAGFVAMMGDLPAARDFGRRTWRSLQAVAAPGATFRYISGGEVPDRADGSATAVAEVEWRPSGESGLDPAVTHRSTVDLTVTPQDDGTLSIVGAGQQAGSAPLWLLGAVTVDRDDRRVVLSIDGGGVDRPVPEMASQARSAVERAVPDARGDLVVVSPATQAQMAAMVGQPEDAVAQIAAVTTDIDGDTATRDAVVVLNPDVFATMDQRAAQVVLSHEATHALTPAVGTTAANWVVEGFADYVALRDDPAPLTVSAGQILREVSAGRGPTQLPADADFGSTQHGLGAVYESAWMVFRMLGEQHPPSALVTFYEAVIGGAPVDEALETSFGLTVDQLTSDWLDYLTKSASTVS